jgi:hypothetical protein
MTHTETVQAIYEAYPRHRDRRKALAQIEKALQRLERGERGQKMRADEAQMFLLEVTKNFARSPAGSRGIYTPYPGTWFCRAGYLDDQEDWDFVTRDEIQEIERRREALVGT